MFILYIIFLLIYFSFPIFLFYLILAFIIGAPFVPSSKRQTRKMIDLADIKKGMKVYDLGSGDGRLLLEAAKKGADAIGYEINPFLVLFTKLRILISPYRNKISVFRTNFWHSDIKNANVVFIYLIPWEMEKLEKFLVDNLRKNTIVVSNSFIFPNLKLIKSSPKHHIYLFRI